LSLVGNEAPEADLQPADPHASSEHTAQQILDRPVNLGI
jgi:hypothetical protein